MNIVHNGITYDDAFIKNFIAKLNDSLNDICAFEYNKFVNHKFGNFSIIDIIQDLDRNVAYDDTCPKTIGKTIPSLDTQKALIVEFFSMFGLKDKVQSILDNTHADYKTCISNKLNDSSVGHRGYNEFLTYEVQFSENVEGCATLAHEMGHALSNHHAKAMTLAKATNIAEKNFGKDSDEFKNQRQIYRDFTDSKQRNHIDCVGEIESHITEKLFMYFLVKKGIITKEDFNVFITGLNNSLRDNLTLMIEENEIIKELHNPITEQDFMNLYNKFSNTSKFDNMFKRLSTMANRKDNPNSNERRFHSKHRFRYVVGEVISTMWMKKYLESDKTEKQSMLKNFVKYLGKSDKCTLENCCELVLGKGETLDATITDYINFISTQQLSI